MNYQQVNFKKILKILQMNMLISNNRKIKSRD